MTAAARTLSGIIAAHVEAGRLVTIGAFLDRIGGPGLATVTVLYPVDCPATTRVQLLADALAA